MKKHIGILIFGTLLAAFSLGSIITFTDPGTTGFITLTFFYVSLLLTSLGVFTTVGVVIRYAFFGGMYVTNLSHSFRQAMLVSFLIIVSLILLRLGLLFWWVEITLIMFLVFFELFLSLKD
jgi:hypothetical protein